MAFLCNNQITAARGNSFQNHSSKQGELPQAAPRAHATGDAAGAGSWAGGQKACSHPYRMRHFIEKNQCQEQFPSFHQKIPFTIPSPILVVSLPGNTLDNLLSIMKNMCAANFVELTLFWEHLLNISNGAIYHLGFGKCFGAELPATRGADQKLILEEIFSSFYTMLLGIQARKQALENALDHSGQNAAQWMGWAPENTKCQLKNSSHVACVKQPAKSSNKSSKGFSATSSFCSWANCFLSHLSANFSSVTKFKTSQSISRSD